MNDLEFLAAQQAYLFAPKGERQKRLEALRAINKALLKAGTPRRKMKRKRAA